MKTGYIYQITNKINNKIYIGQTSRDPEIRFDEHCHETRGTSRLHDAIQKYGYRNFKWEILECPPLEQLDEREIYWINIKNSINPDIGYNITFGGVGVNRIYPHIHIIENNLIIESQEELCRIINNITSWTVKYLRKKIKKSVEEGTDFLGYHLEKVDGYTNPITDLDTVEDWIKTLNIRYCGKHVYSPELDMSFDTIASAANYLYKNGYYTGNAKTPIQAIVTMISNNIHGKTDKLVNCSNISFEYAPGTIKNTGGDFSAKSIYCPQIQKTFASEVEAAHYFIDNKIWNGIKFKTAKLRISDVVRGYFQDYRGYTFSVSQE